MKIESWLGKGRYGEVHLVEVNGKKMAQKTYKDRKDRDSIFSKLEDSYSRLKQGGCRIPSEYLVDKNNFVTYATDLTENGKYIVSGYGNTHKNENGGKLEVIDNFETFIQDAFNNAIKSAEQVLEVAGDAYLFQREKDKTSSSVDIFIADIDGVINPPVSSSDVGELKYYNLDSVKYALRWWVQKKVANPNGYLMQLEDMFSDYLKINNIKIID